VAHCVLLFTLLGIHTSVSHTQCSNGCRPAREPRADNTGVPKVVWLSFRLRSSSITGSGTSTANHRGNWSLRRLRHAGGFQCRHLCTASDWSGLRPERTDWPVNISDTVMQIYRSDEELGDVCWRRILAVGSHRGKRAMPLSLQRLTQIAVLFEKKKLHPYTWSAIVK